jgi:hypothetical protein
MAWQASGWLYTSKWLPATQAAAEVKCSRVQSSRFGGTTPSAVCSAHAVIIGGRYLQAQIPYGFLPPYTCDSVCGMPNAFLITMTVLAVALHS